MAFVLVGFELNFAGAGHSRLLLLTATIVKLTASRCGRFESLPGSKSCSRFRDGDCEVSDSDCIDHHDVSPFICENCRVGATGIFLSRDKRVLGSLLSQNLNLCGTYLLKQKPS